ALVGIKGIGPVSDAHRFYLRGLRLCREGDLEAARQVWQSVVDSFKGNSSEDRWVELSQAGLNELSSKTTLGTHKNEAVRDALKRARSLKDQGKKSDAEKILKGLLLLYRDDASLSDVLNEIESERNR